MPLAISKECFPTPTKCHNCLRKRSSEVRKDSHPAEEYKRCSGCHIMTYCDKDCQKEHWIRVHKTHCRFLSGKVLADGCQHNTSTCPRCIAQNQASSAQLSSQNSPRTVCIVEEVILAMNAGLSAAFEFHREGKKCSCDLQFAFELPFPLWEVSGQYLETASTGLDAMMAHVLNVLTAMSIKAKGPLREDHKNILTTLWANIVTERVKVWYYILEGGMPLIPENALEVLSQQVDSLQTFYEVSNPWWKTLRFSVYFVMKTNENLNSNFSALHGLDDPKFQILKMILDYQHSQIEKQAIVSKNKMWSNFMLWPALVNSSLTLLLPPGTRCQNCFSQLSGQLTISPDVNFKSLVIVDIGDNGALMASCPASKNSNCWTKCLSKNVVFRVRSDEVKWEESFKENDLFKIESRECDFCLKSSLSSHRCSACLTVQYCSTVCQKKDLDFHKTVCEKWAKDKSRKILGKGKQKEYWKSVFCKK